MEYLILRNLEDITQMVILVFTCTNKTQAAAKLHKELQKQKIKRMDCFQSCDFMLFSKNGFSFFLTG